MASSGGLLVLNDEMLISLEMRHLEGSGLPKPQISCSSNDILVVTYGADLSVHASLGFCRQTLTMGTSLDRRGTNLIYSYKFIILHLYSTFPCRLHSHCCFSLSA